MPALESTTAALTRLREYRKTVQDLGSLGITDAVAWAESLPSVNFDLDDWQKDFLRDDHDRLLLLCSRQSGKTLATSLRGGWIVRNGGLAVCIAPTQRQSSILFKLISEHLTAAGCDIARATQTEIELTNGGKAVCLPGDRPSGLRGLSLRHPTRSALICDESAFLRETIWPSISPMMAAAPDCELTMLSTPSGPAGRFYEAWASDEDWHRTRVTADDCERISPKFLERERARLGDEMFRQEYMAEFVSPAGAYFSAGLINSLFDAETSDPITDIFERQAS